MAPGSLIGFALVFFFCTWAASIVAGFGLRFSKRRLRQLGAGAEKRAAALALIVPPLLGGTVALALAGFSFVAPWYGLSDHCGTHGHHIHLCLLHGGEWAELPWAVSLISALAAILLVRLARLAEAMWRARQRLRIVEQSSTRISASGPPVFLAPSEQSFCFVAGVRTPRIYVSESLWSRQSSDEREAMLEHERAHVRNGDLWRSIVLSAFALLGAPLVAARCRGLWSDATERFCDRLAADQTGDTEAVASALLNMVRGQRLRGALAFLHRPESVKDRVVAVLSIERTGQRAAARIGWGAAGVVSVAAIATGALADPLHHILETFFSLI